VLQLLGPLLHLLVEPAHPSRWLRLVEEDDDYGRRGRKKNERRQLPTCREGVWRGRRGREEDIKVAAARCGVDASSEPICKALKMSCVAASAFKEAAGG